MQVHIAENFTLGRSLHKTLRYIKTLRSTNATFPKRYASPTQTVRQRLLRATLTLRIRYVYFFLTATVPTHGHHHTYPWSPSHLPMVTITPTHGHHHTYPWSPSHLPIFTITPTHGHHHTYTHTHTHTQQVTPGAEAMLANTT